MHVDGDSEAGASLISEVCGEDSRAILKLVNVHPGGYSDAVPLINFIWQGAEARAAHQLINTHAKDDCGAVYPINGIGGICVKAGVARMLIHARADENSA